MNTGIEMILTPEGESYLMSVMNDQKIQWYAVDKMNKIFGLWVLLVLGACKSEYTSLVERELASGQRYDSLIYGLHLGDSQKSFTQCWELNKKGLVKQGPNNQYVELIQKELDSTNFAKKIQTLFYGEFDADKKMVALRMKFSFDGWGSEFMTTIPTSFYPRLKTVLIHGSQDPTISLKSNRRNSLSRICEGRWKPTSTGLSN